MVVVTDATVIFNNIIDVIDVITNYSVIFITVAINASNCDSPISAADGRLQVVAFVGGLDITDGRFDTPEFPLFSTLSTAHSGDFYSNCFPGATAASGPRQPWHDIHAKIEGAGALQVGVGVWVCSYE